MGKFFQPLLVFVVGNLCLLITLLFLPAVDTASTQLANATAGQSEWIWGWDWLMAQGVVRFLIYLIFEGVILWATAKVFLAQRNR